MIRIALVGQPNCGKSTLFNHLVGYKAHTSNLPGTTVEFLTSEALVDGTKVELVDLPGTYSLQSLDEAERETRSYLLNEPVDCVLNVIDASLLSRSLELTLQLLELGIPLVACLNMEDEARRKGVSIDTAALADQLTVPVFSTVAIRGVGVKQAISAAVRAARQHRTPRPPRYSADVESALSVVAAAYPENGRLEALRRFESEGRSQPHAAAPDAAEILVREKKRLQTLRGRPAAAVISSERHAKSMDLFEAVATVGPSRIGLRDRLDAVLMHRVLGVVFLAAILYGLFYVVFTVGSFIEGPIMLQFDRWIEGVAVSLSPDGAAFYLVRGLLEGLAGTIGIVIPFLFPLLLGLAVFEDVGYLPRAGYLADGLMHRIGLHGKSVIPFILGYGCSVPAILATRILDSRRDRFVTAMLAVMVPCAARTIIISGLVLRFLGPHFAFLIYVINLVVIAAVGRLLTKFLPQVTPGLILEIPSYKVPSLRVIGAKVWLRIYEFLRYAAPILILGSVVLGALDYLGVDRILNLAVSPVTWLLGLPLAVGVPLIFGVFRKELSLVMLYTALATTGATIGEVLSAGQMVTFTLFALFYVPCVATIAVLRKELGWRETGWILLGTTAIALLVGLLSRGTFALFGS